MKNTSLLTLAFALAAIANQNLANQSPAAQEGENVTEAMPLLARATQRGGLSFGGAEIDVAAFADGLALSDFTAKPAQLVILQAGEERSVADVILTEGKFHQVKRMFAAVGHPLVSLSRLRIGTLALDPELAPGEWRELRGDEIEALKAICGM